MDLITIVAFVLGVVIVGAFFIIKNYKLIDADKTASKIIGVLNKTLSTYAGMIREYDKENGTTYYVTLEDMMKNINAMEQDTEITPLDFALKVIEMYEDITTILQNVNLLDKVVKVEDKI